AEAIEMAFGIAPPPMGTVVRNLGQAAEFLYDHEWLRIADYSAGSVVQHTRLFSSSGGPLTRSRLNPARQVLSQPWEPQVTGQCHTLRPFGKTHGRSQRRTSHTT